MTFADLSRLFDPGATWTGTEAVFKPYLLGDGLLTKRRFGYRQGDGIDCPGGDVGQTDRLLPGDHWDIQLRQYFAYLFDDQAFPAGRVPVTAMLRYGFTVSDDQDHHLQVTGVIDIDGRPLPGATPQQLADAMLGNGPFDAWLRGTDPALWVNTDIGQPSFVKRVDWNQFGFHGPFPDGTAFIGLFADNHDYRTEFGQLMINPWTAQVFEFVIR